MATAKEEKSIREAVNLIAKGLSAEQKEKFIRDEIAAAKKKAASAQVIPPEWGPGGNIGQICGTGVAPSAPKKKVAPAIRLDPEWKPEPLESTKKKAAPKKAKKEPLEEAPKKRAAPKKAKKEPTLEEELFGILPGGEETPPAPKKKAAPRKKKEPGDTAVKPIPKKRKQKSPLEVMRDKEKKRKAALAKATPIEFIHFGIGDIKVFPDGSSWRKVKNSDATT